MAAQVNVAQVNVVQVNVSPQLLSCPRPRPRGLLSPPPSSPVSCASRRKERRAEEGGAKNGGTGRDDGARGRRRDGRGKRGSGRLALGGRNTQDTHDLVNLDAVTPRISQVPGDKVVEAHDILLVARIGVIVVGRGVALHFAVVPLQPVDIRQARNPANNNRPPPCHHSCVLGCTLRLEPSSLLLVLGARGKRRTRER
jgi:hypothetical protein